MNRRPFGWDLPPGLSRLPEEPEPSPESVRAQEILEAAGVDEGVIEQVTQIIDELAERTTECASCERRLAEEEDRIENIAREELGTEPPIYLDDLEAAPDVDSGPRLRRYQTQINDVAAGNWLTVEAETQEDAALEALRRSRPLPELPCSVYVGDLRTPTHGDGTPMVVQQFQIVRAPQEAAPITTNNKEQ